MVLCFNASESEIQIHSETCVPYKVRCNKDLLSAIDNESRRPMRKWSKPSSSDHTPSTSHKSCSSMAFFMAAEQERTRRYRVAAECVETILKILLRNPAVPILYIYIFTHIPERCACSFLLHTFGRQHRRYNTKRMSASRTNSPGHRPNGVSDLPPSLLFSSICRLSLILGPPLGHKSRAAVDLVTT